MNETGLICLIGVAIVVSFIIIRLIIVLGEQLDRIEERVWRIKEAEPVEQKHGD